MMKTITLATLVAFTMACGEGPQGTSHTKKYDIACYSGGQKLIDVTNATEVRQYNGIIEYVTNNITTRTTAECVLVEKIKKETI